MSSEWHICALLGMTTLSQAGQFGLLEEFAYHYVRNGSV